MNIAKRFVSIGLLVVLPSTIYSYVAGHPSAIGASVVFALIGTLVALNAKAGN